MPASSSSSSASRKAKREAKAAWNRLLYFLTGLAFMGCIVLHIYITLTSQFELDQLESEAKVFVTNSMAKAVEIESEVAEEVLPIVQEVFSWEQQLLNVSQAQLKQLSFLSAKSDDQLSPADDRVSEEEADDGKEDPGVFEVVSEGGPDAGLDRDDDLTVRSEKLYHRLTCPDADLVTFWKQTTKDDLRYRTPYAMPDGSEPKYVTFEPGLHST
jgi:hypothetical protein